MPHSETLRRPDVHVFIADPGDPEVCVSPTCGLPQRNSVHQVPTTTDEQAAHEARRLGETGGSDG